MVACAYNPSSGEAGGRPQKKVASIPKDNTQGYPLASASSLSPLPSLSLYPSLPLLKSSEYIGLHTKDGQGKTGSRRL